jgi:hypothetical protein
LRRVITRGRKPKSESRFVRSQRRIRAGGVFRRRLAVRQMRDVHDRDVVQLSKIEGRDDLARCRAVGCDRKAKSESRFVRGQRRRMAGDRFRRHLVVRQMSDVHHRDVVESSRVEGRDDLARRGAVARGRKPRSGSRFLRSQRRSRSFGCIPRGPTVEGRGTHRDR